MLKNKIVILCGFQSAYAGNFISSMFELFNNLKKFEIHFLFPLKAQKRYWIKHLEENGYHINYYDNSSKFKKIKTIKKLLNKIKPNILYCHFESPLLIKFCLPFKRIDKIVFHIHSDFSGGKVGFVEKIRNIILYKINLFRFKYIFVNDDFPTKNNLKDSIIIKNAICKKRLINENEVYISTNFNTPKIKLLLFAWSPYIKGLDILLDSLSLVKNTFHLFIVRGEDNSHEICKYIDDRDLNNYCTVLPPTSNVFYYINGIDIFISASRSEGFSYSILEALVSNKIVIVSSINSNAWATKYKNCYVFESGNPLSLHKLLSSLVNENALLSNEQVSQPINQDYSFVKWKKNVLSILLGDKNEN